MATVPLDELLRRRLVTRLLAMAAVLLAPLAAARAETPAKPVVGQAYLTADSAFALSLRPRQVLTNPALSLLPVEVAAAAGRKYLGVDPASIVSAVVVSEPLLGAAPNYALFLQANQDWDLTRLAPELTAHTRPGKVGGRDCLVSTSPALPCLLVLKGKTLVAATQDMLEKLLDRDRPQAEGVLAQLLAGHPPGDDLYLAIDAARMRQELQLAMLWAAQATPPELRPLLSAPQLLESVELTLNPDGSRPSRLAATAATPTDAQQLQTLLDQCLAQMEARMRGEAEAAIARFRTSADPVERSIAAYADRLSDSYFALFKPTRDGNRFLVFDTGADAARTKRIVTIGALFALLSPAAQAASEATQRTEAPQVAPAADTSR